MQTPLKRNRGIDDYGSLQAFLDDPEVRERHRGYGYDDYVKNRTSGSKMFRARMFGFKSSKAIRDYDARYAKENVGKIDI